MKNNIKRTSISINNETLEMINKLSPQLAKTSLNYKVNYFLNKGIESYLQNSDLVNDLARLIINKIDNVIMNNTQNIDVILEEILRSKALLLSVKRYCVANNVNDLIDEEIIKNKASDFIENKFKEDIKLLNQKNKKI